MHQQQRQHTRYIVEIAGEVTLGLETISVATQNVSEGGAALVLDVAIDQGTTVDLSLFLTQDGIEDPDQEPFETKATIAWVRPHDGGRVLAGVGFGAVTAEGRQLLRTFLAAMG